MSLQGVQVRQGRARSRCLSRRPMAPQGQPPARRPLPSSQPQTEQPSTTQVLLPSQVTGIRDVILQWPCLGIKVIEMDISQHS